MPGNASSRLVLRGALLLGVPLGGFLLGRSLSPRPQDSESPALTANSPQGETQRLLRELASGNLAAARSKVAALKDTPDSEELVSLLVTIAIRDGASFDALIAGFPEAHRRNLVQSCMYALHSEPSAFVRLLADSQEFTRIALEPPRQWACNSIGKEPDLFLDLLEQGRFDWPQGALDEVVLSVLSHQPKPAQALRLLELCGKEQVKIEDTNTLEELMRVLPEDAFAKLRQTNFGTTVLLEALVHEMEDRLFLANFSEMPLVWGEIDRSRLYSGMEQMIQSSGVPSLPWAVIPADLRQELAGRMLVSAVDSQGDAGARGMLDSIMKSGLPEQERNRMLEESATRLFELHGNIRLAIDFAQSITSDADGNNAGEDLLVKWTAYDPISAKVHIDKSEPSPYRDRLLERVKELTP